MLSLYGGIKNLGDRIFLYFLLFCYLLEQVMLIKKSRFNYNYQRDFNVQIHKQKQFNT